MNLSLFYSNHSSSSVLLQHLDTSGSPPTWVFHHLPPPEPSLWPHLHLFLNPYLLFIAFSLLQHAHNPLFLSTRVYSSDPSTNSKYAP